MTREALVTARAHVDVLIAKHGGLGQSAGDLMRAIQTEFKAFAATDPDVMHEIVQGFLHANIVHRQRMRRTDRQASVNDDVDPNEFIRAQASRRDDWND